MHRRAELSVSYIDGLDFMSVNRMALNRHLGILSTQRLTHEREMIAPPTRHIRRRRYHFWAYIV